MAKSPYVFDVTAKEFLQKVVEKSKETPVVVDFWAPWCGPCRALTPVLEKAIDERQGEFLLAKVNIDEEQSLAMEFGVQSIPMVVGFRNGRATLDFLGVLPEIQIQEFLNQLGPSEADKSAKGARELEATDPAAAEKAYREILEKDRQQEDALLGLSRLLIAVDKDAEAQEWLENVIERKNEVDQLRAKIWIKGASRGLPDEAALRGLIEKEPKNAQRTLELGLVLAAAGKYPESLEQMLTAGEKDFKLAGTKVREAMVQVFHLMGDQNPQVNEYRSRLATLLY